MKKLRVIRCVISEIENNFKEVYKVNTEQTSIPTARMYQMILKKNKGNNKVFRNHVEKFLRDFYAAEEKKNAIIFCWQSFQLKFVVFENN